MYSADSMNGAVARILAAGRCLEDLPRCKDQAALDDDCAVLPSFEISDKDYRSFCWPCHALEETGDCKSGT
jgi:hypothetical protein